ncbi:MAG: hypothetical protein DRI98_11845 [Bacteroidetes bacterium]|nr:MAG: hypothetical protein DRI98_11845 [Bacteroidota bacterium]
MKRKNREIKCEWCGKVRDECKFIIGASSKPDWVMVYGTGKMTCPDCHPKAMKDADIARDKWEQANEKGKFLKEMVNDYA